MSLPQKPALYWLRHDLRLGDNPALAAALASGAPLLCIYIFDEASPGLRHAGGASKWWLHHSLQRLSGALQAIGGRLDLFQGAAQDIIVQLAQASGATGIFWNRRYGKSEIALDTALKTSLIALGVEVASFNASLLHEPWQVRSKSQTPFKVFSPYWRAVVAQRPWPAPLPAPGQIVAADYPGTGPGRATLAQLRLLPVKPDWAGGLAQTWQPGEQGASKRLAQFIDGGIDHYGEDRNRPDMPEKSSRLSPHLRFGEISPRQIVQSVEDAGLRGAARQGDIDKFLSELGWREFSYHLLFHQPDLATRNFNPRFDDFPWRDVPPSEIAAWQRGQTGYPLVDAGMRQLWQTGFMHNRVRMVTASFLIKHLMADWRLGEAWFWDTLCDADPANNAASWQWVAGSGADAAPYFRIFNPVLQGERFDPKGDYVRKFVPELAKMPDQWIHKPWLAPADILRRANVRLGQDYPAPIIDHALARDRALAGFAQLGEPASN